MVVLESHWKSQSRLIATEVANNSQKESQMKDEMRENER